MSTDSDTRSSAAAFPAGLVDAFDDAQRRTIDLMGLARDRLEVGMSEADIVDEVEAQAKSAGFNLWFRPPYAHLDCPERPAFLPDKKGRLAKGMVVEIDAAPATDEAYGVFGAAFVFGGGTEPKLLIDAKEACKAACGFASRWKCTGEVFVYAQAWANNRSYRVDSDSVGHACFPRLGRTAGAWPHLARAATLMRRHRITWLNPRRMHGFYAIQPRLVLDGRGCAIEELVFVDGNEKRILGRPGGLGEIGRF